MEKMKIVKIKLIPIDVLKTKHPIKRVEVSALVCCTVQEKKESHG